MSVARNLQPTLTAERHEMKYRISSAGAFGIAGSVGGQLLPYVHGAAGDAPGSHFLTTVYFDTPGGDLYANARAAHGALKVRARIYYALHAATGRLGTGHRISMGSPPSIWLEVKESSGQRSSKHRFCIPLAEFERLFANTAITSAALARLHRCYGEASTEIAGRLALLCQRFESNLRPSAVVNYHRRAWQSEDETLRVTLDQRIAYFMPNEGLCQGGASLYRPALGPATGQEDDCIIEVKSLAAPPPWLDRSLRNAGARPATFSKFAAAAEAAQVGAGGGAG